MGGKRMFRALGAMVLPAVMALQCTSTSPRPSAPLDFSATAPPAPAAWTHLEQRQQLVGGVFGGDGNQFVMGAAAYGDGYVVVGESFKSDQDVTARIWTSPNGIDWAFVDDPLAGLQNAQINSIASDGRLLLAVGSSRPEGQSDFGPPPVVWSSSDARTWRRVADAPESLADFGLAGIAGQHGTFIAWGRSKDGAVRLFRTSDGIEWKEIESESFSDGAVNALAPYRSGWLAVGATRQPDPMVVGGRSQPARAWWSPDGATWLPASIAEGPSVTAALPGAGGVLGVGSSDCGSCVANANLWQGDGRTWRLLGPDRLTWPAYATDGSRIVVWDWQGSGSFGWSADGTTWNPLGDPVRDARSNGVVVVGARGLLIPLGTGDEPIDSGVLYLEAS